MSKSASFKSSRLTSFEQHLPKHSVPAGILQKGQHLRVLAEQLNRFLPSELQTHCQLANLDQETLIFVAQNAHWATHLYHLEVPLIQAATELTSRKITALKVVVEPSWSPITEPHTEHHLSTQAADNLRSTASYLDDNPRLQQALQQLAKHADEPSQ